jgi:uncharacterized protein (TIGR03066 family)
MNSPSKHLGALCFATLLLTLVGCGRTTPEKIDAANLVGRWELVSNGETEWFDIAADGSFTAKIDRNGFIATTLSQGPHVTLEGTWKLTDRTIIFQLRDSSDPSLTGQSHSYEILTLTDRSMDTVNASGQRKTLRRAI